MADRGQEGEDADHGPGLEREQEAAQPAVLLAQLDQPLQLEVGRVLAEHLAERGVHVGVPPQGRHQLGQRAALGEPAHEAHGDGVAAGRAGPVGGEALGELLEPRHGAEAGPALERGLLLVGRAAAGGHLGQALVEPQGEARPAPLLEREQGEVRQLVGERGQQARGAALVEAALAHDHQGAAAEGDRQHVRAIRRAAGELGVAPRELGVGRGQHRVRARGQRQAQGLLDLRARPLEQRAEPARVRLGVGGVLDGQPARVAQGVAGRRLGEPLRAGGGGREQERGRGERGQRAVRSRAPPALAAEAGRTALAGLATGQDATPRGCPRRRPRPPGRPGRRRSAGRPRAGSP